MIRVVLVDDEPPARVRMRQLLDAAGGVVVVGEADTAEIAFGRIPATNPDVAVLDVRLPDGDGIEVCRDVRSKHPEIACLMLTSFSLVILITNILLNLRYLRITQLGDFRNNIFI